MKKYICYSGYVVSKNDKELHLILASDLPDLYNINYNECIFVPAPNQNLIGLDTNKYIELYPRSDGNYKINIKE